MRPAARKYAALGVLFAVNAIAADDPKIDALQAAIAWSQQQTNSCNAQQLQMAAELASLRKRIAELEAKANQPGSPSKELKNAPRE